MAEDIKKLLVALDFSELTEMVVENAAVLAKKINIGLELIHIENNKQKQKEATGKLKMIEENTTNRYGIPVISTIKEGSIFSTISDYANELKPPFVVMGTHGIKGMQKIFGSKALKVIVGSSVPFWVVQKPPKSDDIKNIILPIDYTFESKEKLNIVKFLSYFYKFKVNIVTPNLKDQALRNKIKNNLTHVDKILEERKIEYEIVIGADKGDMADAVNKVAGSMNADLIIVTSTKNIGWNDYIFGAPEQKVIPNQYKIPVICVNPRTDLTKTGSFR
ncbi:MAG: universal stress protein [Bacteroidia bacterium]|nr:universal stress protein [Bacteroidia bacterium]